ncbi:MAG: hypothetical protein ACK445_10355 [Bacteroidota bacterium]|jgi:hypothetical protein
MHKHITICLSAMVLCVCTNAQFRLPDSLFLKNGHVFVETGVSIPVMDYASTDFIVLSSGFAQTGYSWQAGMQYDVLPWLGLGIQYYVNENNFDDAALAQSYIELSANNPRLPIIYNGFQSDPWKMRGMMFGLYLPVRNYLSTFTIGMYAGFMNATLPASQLYITERATGQPATIFQYEASGNDAAYYFFVGFRTRLYKNLVFTSKASFLYSEQRFEEISGYFTGLQRAISFSPYTQYHHIINLNAGLGWQFR